MNNLFKSSIALLVMISFISMPLLADDFKDLTRSIEKALKNENKSSFDKANLVRKLSTYSSAETVEFCYKILKFKDKNAKKLEKEAQSIQAEIDSLQKKVDDLHERFRQAGNRATPDEIKQRDGYVAEIKKRQQFLLKLEDKMNSMSVAKTAVIYVLSKMDTKAAQMAMLEGLDDRDWRVVYATVEAFGKQKFERAFNKIAQHYPVDGKPHKSDLVRTAVVKALRMINQEKALDILIVALKDKNVIIRTQAALGLGQIGTKECIMPLINQLEKESGRLKWDIVTMLTNLTGKNYGDNVEQWRSWWHANKNKAELKKVDDVLKKTDRGEGSHKTGASFYGVEIESDHPIFIIDQSGSMQSAADWNVALKQIEQWKKANPGKNMIPPIPPPAGRMSKWEVLQYELKRVIMKLDSRKADFNIVWYSTGVEVYNKGGMVKANAKEKDKASKEISRRNANGMTNIYEALETAFMLASGKTKKGDSEWTGKGDAEIHADTFFFMTDGSPTEGPVQDVNQILAKVVEWNKGINIKIHSIGVGLCHEPFLRALAEQNNGSFTVHKTEPKKEKK
ncbi:MAG: HEAT repeat domain-containing protein [Planctomycetes bacterium]|nr:HEAT repeat domain-containing protein [Planctomycetota bacterium]